MDMGVQRWGEVKRTRSLGRLRILSPARRQALQRLKREAAVSQPNVGYRSGLATGLAEASSQSMMLEPAATASLSATPLPVAADVPSTRLPPALLWLAFAGWVVCCGMLFVSLVQRPQASLSAVEDPSARSAAPLLPAVMSAALETPWQSGAPADGAEWARRAEDNGRQTEPAGEIGAPPEAARAESATPPSAP